MNQDVLPVRLRESAYRADNGELAWSREDAVKVIQWAHDHSVVILGGEIWLPTIPGPTIPSPHIYQWTVDLADGERWEDFVRRSAVESRAYVEGFAWDNDDRASPAIEPYFNLVLATAADSTDSLP